MPKQYNGQIDIQEVRGAVYITGEGHIDCEINHPEHGWIPYTIAPDDGDMTVDNQQLLDLIDAQGGPSPMSDEARFNRQADIIRLIRNTRLIQEVDPIASNTLRWQELSQQQRNSWAEYRQLLLDVPQQSGFPFDVVWPNPPE